MKKLTRVLIGVVAVLLIVAAIGVFLFYRAGQTGTTPVERWVGSQLQAVAGAYLNPELKFERLDYRYPRTVVLNDFALRADDPDRPAERIDILAAERITLELVKVPREGEPVKIERLILEKPEIRFVVAGGGKPGFVGFSNLTKQTGTTPTQPGQPSKPSDLFQLRLVEVRDGLLVYDSREPGAEPMRLDRINTRMEIEPSGDGWYKLATTLKREPIADTRIDGRLNIDTMTVELAEMTLAMALSPDNAGSLPPNLQRLIKDHDVTGSLSATCSGTLRLSEWRRSALDIRAELRDGHAAAGEYRLPIELLTAQIRVDEGAANLQPIDVKTLGGTLRLDGRVALDAGMPTNLHATARKLRIEETLRVIEKGANTEPKYSGLVDADVTFAGPLADWDTRAGGGGEAHLTQGRLERLPVMYELIRVIKKVGEAAVLGRGAATPSDELHATFDLAGDKAHFTKIDGRTSLLGLRGEGDIYFNQRLDLTVNAGPVEKLESVLGDAGKIIGVVTDKLTAYHVTGTLGEPRVQLKVAPGGKDVLGDLIK
jgi:hypothetical protein